MKILFIRNSDYNLEQSHTHDHKFISLTKVGTIKTKIFARKLKQLGYEIDMIITTPLRYCIETSELITNLFQKTKILIYEKLNINMTFEEFSEMISGYYDNNKTIAIIGTGREFLKFIQLITDNIKNIHFGKLSMIELEINKNLKGHIISNYSFKDIYEWNGINNIFNKSGKKYGTSEIYELYI